MSRRSAIMTRRAMTSPGKGRQWVRVEIRGLSPAILVQRPLPPVEPFFGVVICPLSLHTYKKKKKKARLTTHLTRSLEQTDPNLFLPQPALKRGRNSCLNKAEPVRALSPLSIEHTQHTTHNTHTHNLTLQWLIAKRCRNGRFNG